MNKNVSPVIYIYQITYLVFVGLVLLRYSWGDHHEVLNSIVLVLGGSCLMILMGIYLFYIILAILVERSDDYIFKYTNFQFTLFFIQLGMVFIGLYMEQIVYVEIGIAVALLIGALVHHVKRKRLYE